MGFHPLNIKQQHKLFSLDFWHLSDASYINPMFRNSVMFSVILFFESMKVTKYWDAAETLLYNICEKPLQKCISTFP